MFVPLSSTYPSLRPIPCTIGLGSELIRVGIQFIQPNPLVIQGESHTEIKWLIVINSKSHVRIWILHGQYWSTGPTYSYESLMCMGPKIMSWELQSHNFRSELNSTSPFIQSLSIDIRILPELLPKFYRIQNDHSSTLSDRSYARPKTPRDRPPRS